MSQPARSGPCQNSTSPASGFFPNMAFMATAGGGRAGPRGCPSGTVSGEQWEVGRQRCAQGDTDELRGVSSCSPTRHTLEMQIFGRGAGLLRDLRGQGCRDQTTGVGSGVPPTARRLALIGGRGSSRSEKCGKVSIHARMFL